MRLSEFSEDPEAAEIAAGLGRALLQRRVFVQRTRMDEISQIALEVEVLVDIAGPEGQRPPQGLDAIYGSGLVNDGGLTAPVLLIDQRAVGQDAVPGELLTLSDHPGLNHVVEGLTAMKPARDILIYPIPEPLPYFRTAEGVNGPGTLGTLGALFTDRNGQQRITTAGHVAPTGAQVTDAAGALGNVIWSHDPAVTAGPAPAADVALIAPQQGMIGPASFAINGMRNSMPRDNVEVHGGVTALGTSETMGLIVPGMYVPSMSGMWANLYFTTTAASVPGDSGAAVLAAGTSDIVGHIVSGAAGLTSYFQSIDVQLQATGCVL